VGTGDARDERRYRDPAGPQPTLNQKVDAADQRRSFEIDRDRILYCSAFRRLAGVTQVVTSTEGHVFHNRLTHSMKAAQVGRRLAQRLLRESTQLQVDPEVVEAAALAHDLGHPPFGHIGETTLDALVSLAKHGATDGYEGNAQTFRILTKLASRRPAYSGLNLARATLRAVIKYPWYKGKAPPGKEDKWNAYGSEKEDFEFALGGPPVDGLAKCPEAQLMEWADDIAYSVHDLEDFYRAGLIPLDLLVRDTSERQAFIVHQCPAGAIPEARRAR
jgi:dGTPase